MTDFEEILERELTLSFTDEDSVVAEMDRRIKKEAEAQAEGFKSHQAALRKISEKWRARQSAIEGDIRSLKEQIAKHHVDLDRIREREQAELAAEAGRWERAAQYSSQLIDAHRGMIESLRS